MPGVLKILALDKMYQFKMNNRSLRFLSALLVGYYYFSELDTLEEYLEKRGYGEKEAGKLKNKEEELYNAFKEGRSLPFMEIGKCTPQ